jgi:hypothetical protein
MTLVHDLLTQRPGLGLPPRTFLATWCVTMLVRRGRVHFRHRSRDGDDSERPMARPFRAPFAWPNVHPHVRLTALAPRAARVAAPDASCIPTRGEQTCGRGPLCNGGASRAARGLELSARAVVAVTRRGACMLAVAPTPPGAAATQAEPEEPRVDCSTPPRRAPRPRLPPGVTDHGVEGYEAQKTYLADVVSLDLHARTTRRSDADGVVLDTGPHPKRRGARRT